ncbi:MAG: hypothetical protein MI919_40175, partial [Holophagales bacterium]|nr:hypothetical protein [Holophagales bacterium]
MENRIFWIALIVVVVGVGFVLFQPAVEERLAPELESAWVAVEVEGTGIAEVGRIELDLDTPFTLRAVVGARTRDGEPVYYTEADALRIAGRDIPAEQLRRWDRRLAIKLRWYTIEGRWPYLPLAPDEGIGAFQIQPFLRSEWPLTWSIPGEIDAANDDHIESEGPLTRQLFGTQRYHVRFELYRGEDDMVPQNVIRSWAVEELREQVDH